MNASKNTYVKKLQIIAEEPLSLRSQVAKDILEYYKEDIEEFFKELPMFQVNDLISKYIFYCHTQHFYDTHYDEIEAIRTEYSYYFSEMMKQNFDLKTMFCWFAFEQTAYEVAEELGLEI